MAMLREAEQSIDIKDPKLIKNCATSAATLTTGAKFEMWAITHRFFAQNPLMNWLPMVLVNVKPLVSLLNMMERWPWWAMKTEKLSIKVASNVLMLDKRPKELWFSRFDLPEGLQIG